MSGFEINGVPVHKLRVVDLKEELEARGLSKSGKKDELIVRLVSYLEANPEEGGVKDSDEGSSDSKDEMMKKWQEEREQLLRENEERRQEELRKEEEANKAREAAEQMRQAEIEQKQKEEEAARVAQEREEERKRQEQSRREAAEAAEKQAREEKEARLAREAEEQRQAKQREAERVAQQKKEEEARLAKQREDAEKEEAAAKHREAEKVKKEKAAAEEKERLRLAEEEKLKQIEEKAAAEEKARKEGKSESNDKEASKNDDDDDTAPDDTLVMEIDQHDLVTEDTEPEPEPAVTEPEIPAAVEAGQVKSLRKIGARTGGESERKRGWGVSKTVTNGGAASISSDSLKDIVPDSKQLMENTDAVIEEGEAADSVEESDPDVAGPKVPDNVKSKKEEPVIKKKRITVSQEEDESCYILIKNLTRPFTLMQLQTMLKRTGTLEDFWIDRIKSTCCVKFSSTDEASETKMALDGITWPVGNPKTLSVSFSSEDQMKKYKDLAGGVLKASSDRDSRSDRVREWDRDKTDDRETERRRHEDDRVGRRSDRDVRLREKSADKSPQQPSKSLEELFKKTAASPSIYWKPLSEEQIKERIELRNKRLMEAKIMKEMQEDTKEALEKSEKLISRRSRSRS